MKTPANEGQGWRDPFDFLYGVAMIGVGGLSLLALGLLVWSLSQSLG